ncbi:hypothetical protein [Flavobacterium oreochromis]|nr:hypothetical protein [Flavobacterium oreochromis]
MLKKIIVTILLFNIMGCRSQETQENNNMEIFDIKKYENLEKDERYISTKNDICYKSGNIRYRILLLNEVIQLEKTEINIPFEEVKVYYLESKRLKITGRYFFNRPIGIWKYYDEAGKLIKENNYDLSYNFTINDLAKKMKEKYDVDIFDLKQTRNVSRYEEKKYLNIPIYEVWSYNKTNPLALICFILNGATGEIIYKGERFIEGEKESLLDQYLKTKNK